MTWEEFEKTCDAENFEMINSLEQQNTALQARIKELEAKIANRKSLRCSGCKWDADGWLPECDGCMRNYERDYYELKQNK